MAIPNEPYTRKEQYLNAMATGNASGVPDTPYAREEMYLDAIVKGGGGGGGGVLVVHNVDGTLDKTWQEIHDALQSSGAVIVADNPPSTSQIVEVGYDSKAKEYWLATHYDQYLASTADSYPHI